MRLKIRAFSVEVCWGEVVSVRAYVCDAGPAIVASAEEDEGHG